MSEGQGHLKSSGEGQGQSHSHAQKVTARGYGSGVIQHFQRLREENELTDFKVVAHGRVFEVRPFFSSQSWADP